MKQHPLKLKVDLIILPLADLKNLGHIIEKVGDFEEIMGHAGAIVDHPNGLKEGGYDLRSDGDAVGG